MFYTVTNSKLMASFLAQTRLKDAKMLCTCFAVLQTQKYCFKVLVFYLTTLIRKFAN